MQPGEDDSLSHVRSLPDWTEAYVERNQLEMTMDTFGKTITYAPESHMVVMLLQRDRNVFVRCLWYHQTRCKKTDYAIPHRPFTITCARDMQMDVSRNKKGQLDVQAVLTPEILGLLEQYLTRIQNDTGYGTVSIVVEKKRVTMLIPSASIRL